ncbi:MAG: ATP-binding cassette domain-containing protein [Treponema sp.]|jgi:molybdate transport system ATP-binding protein|nr:ATP-binding cassette domain-containing protein [Treponema sp.]
MQKKQQLITLTNCRIEDSRHTIVPELSWTMKTGEAWLVTGPNGGGKAAFLNALAGNLSIVPNTPVPGSGQESLYASSFKDSVAIVSLERAAALIEEERNRDESDYLEGGVDHGRSGRLFLYESMHGPLKPGERLPREAARLEVLPQIKLCGVETILDRGLKYMSTGEIRRTLLCSALLSGCRLLLLSDPFAGLDAESRKILFGFFTTIAGRQLSAAGSEYPRIILGMERYTEIPSAITNVLEFSGNRSSFCGTRAEYETRAAVLAADKAANRESEKALFKEELDEINEETAVLEDKTETEDILVSMKHVTVGWDDRKVLDDLTWTLHRGEHWLIRGPNGSGKTTFLELLTGDNMQVFCNDIKIFGSRRGSGESVWDIKKKLGIVSYRLHVEYRMVGGTDLESVIISGFHDSIGLYEPKTDIEKAAAAAWLKLGGFSGRERESFGTLSYGEQRAVLILRAAVKRPPLLILDEPCHGLDEEYRRKILDLLDLVAQSGTTTLLHVTHDPTEVLACEKHILELHPGETPMYRILEN